MRPSDFRKSTWMLALSLIVLLTIPSLLSSAEPSRPLIVAHRGLLRHAPENTLSNCRACLELRLGFEFDVRRTKDGHLVCIHDASVDRTTDGTGNVAQMTLEEIRRLDAGTWFDPKFARERVPTVEEVLKLVARHRQPDLLIRADVKSDKSAEHVVQLAAKHKVLDQVLFLGQTAEDVKELRQASAEAHVAAAANDTDDFQDAVSNSNADWVKVRFLPSKSQIDRARQAGKKLFMAGPVVSGHVPDNWKRAAELSIDAILTDYPLELRATLR